MTRLTFAFAALLLVSAPSWAQTDEEENKAPAPTISADPKAVAVTVDLSASPLTGTCPYSMNLSWTATNASVCTKTGAWTGSASASGSEQWEVNAGALTYTLTCSSNTDSRTISWTNPTQNTNGTATTLTGNKVFHNANAANIEANPPIVLTPAKTSYVLAGLPAGSRAVGVKATNAAGVDSAMSNIASTSITLPVGADTVQAGCTTPPEPKPPTAVTIAATVWDVRNDPRGGQRVGRDVGVIELGATCIGTEPYLSQGTPETGIVAEYWKVPRTNPPTKFYRKPRSAIVVGQCRLQTTS